MCEARHLAFLKLDMELNLDILFIKKLVVIHSSYEELDDTKWDVWVLCLWLRFSKGHRTGYIWAHKSMKTNDNSFDNFKNPDRINNYLTSTYTKGKYILIAWLYYCLNGWFRAILHLSHSQIWKFNNLLIFTNKKMFPVLNAAVIVQEKEYNWSHCHQHNSYHHVYYFYSM